MSYIDYIYGFRIINGRLVKIYEIVILFVWNFKHDNIFDDS